jgi:transposase
MARVEVITGPERRRRWTDEQKRAIVAASLEPGAVDRRRGAPGRGRRRSDLPLATAVSAAANGFAQVMIAPPEVLSSRAANDPF